VLLSLPVLFYIVLDRCTVRPFPFFLRAFLQCVPPLSESSQCALSLPQVPGTRSGKSLHAFAVSGSLGIPPPAGQRFFGHFPPIVAEATSLLALFLYPLALPGPATYTALPSLGDVPHVVGLVVPVVPPFRFLPFYRSNAVPLS